MIQSVQLCINHSTKISRTDIRNARIHFKRGYNVLIGPNGSGKSTILRALALCPFCKVHRADNDVVKYITTETLNPKLGGSFSSYEKMIQAIRATFLSHGQGVVDNLQNQSKARETIVIIDSPETGQDMENSMYIYQGLLRMAAHCQVIVATNSLVFMRNGHLIDIGEHSLPRLVQTTKELAAEFDTL